MDLPNPIHVTLLGLVLAMIVFALTLAQRLGEWRSKMVARILGALASGLVVVWVYLACLWIFKVDLRTVFAHHVVLFSCAGVLSIIAVILGLRVARQRSMTTASDTSKGKQLRR